MFDTKISIVVREDLATWQKLNVVAFLITAWSGRTPTLLASLTKTPQATDTIR